MPKDSGCDEQMTSADELWDTIACIISDLKVSLDDTPHDVAKARLLDKLCSELQELRLIGDELPDTVWCVRGDCGRTRRWRVRIDDCSKCKEASSIFCSSDCQRRYMARRRYRRKVMQNEKEGWIYS